jgi:hypothetical protein
MVSYATLSQRNEAAILLLAIESFVAALGVQR